MAKQDDADGPGPPPRPESVGDRQATAEQEPALRGASPVEVALAGGSPLRVGWFRFYFADQRWEWSTQVEQLHGYLPGSVAPTTELVLAHKHPDDAARVAATLEEIRQSNGTLSTRHRIIDVQGRVHDVLVISERLQDRGGAVIGTHGYYVDATPSDEARDAQVSAVIAQIAEHRAAIEQTKGMLMLIYRIPADTAFELLKWRSATCSATGRAIRVSQVEVVSLVRGNPDQPRSIGAWRSLKSAVHAGSVGTGQPVCGACQRVLLRPWRAANRGVNRSRKRRPRSSKARVLGWST